MFRYTPGRDGNALTRVVKMAAVVALSACQPNCDDPTGPDVQSVLGGVVTLNGEPVVGITMAAGSQTSVTSSTGSYSITVQGESFPLIACAEVRTEPYREVAEASAYYPCPITFDDETPRRLDWAFEHEPPTVEIRAPGDGSRSDDGRFTLNASRTGSERVNGRTALFPVKLQWNSSIDGPLAEIEPGLPVTVGLSMGAHLITASLTDRFGATATDEVTVEVVGPSNEAPTATITAPESGLAYEGGVPLQFTGMGTDPEDGVLTGSSLVWTSSQEGEIGTGESFSRVMADGSHIIVLTASDALGAVGTDTILIRINPAGTGGTIQGTVSIGSVPLSDIPVTLAGPVNASTTTNAQGFYSFGNLPAGTYTVTITPPPGADIGTQQSVTLAEGQTLTVNFAG